MTYSSERKHTAECYISGCTTGTHAAPRPGHPATGGPYSLSEALTIGSHTCNQPMAAIPGTVWECPECERTWTAVFVRDLAAAQALLARGMVSPDAIGWHSDRKTALRTESDRNMNSHVTITGIPPEE